MSEEFSILATNVGQAVKSVRDLLGRTEDLERQTDDAPLSGNRSGRTNLGRSYVVQINSIVDDGNDGGYGTVVFAGGGRLVHSGMPNLVRVLRITGQRKLVLLDTVVVVHAGYDGGMPVCVANVGPSVPAVYPARIVEPVGGMPTVPSAGVTYRHYFVELFPYGDVPTWTPNAEVTDVESTNVVTATLMQIAAGQLLRPNTRIFVWTMEDQAYFQVPVYQYPAVTSPAL